MTTFNPTASPGATQFAVSDDLATRPPTHIVAKAEPTARKLRTFRFPQKLIPIDGGGTLLRLREAPSLAVNTRTMEFEVQGWGIKMPCKNVEDLPRQIARQFLTLFSKADRDTISDTERLLWLNILDKVDFTQFSIDRSAPHYVEGTLRNKNPLMVEWHDGATERLRSSLLPAFHPLDPGDTFSGFAKIGRNHETLAIERVSIIS